MSGDRRLVVGGDGALGAALARRWRAEGREVWTTTRRRGEARGREVPLDLAADPACWALPEGCGVAVLCAAVTGREECRRDPDGTWRVNVENTLALAHRLADSGYFTVLLSTSLVFGGRRPFPREDDPPSPAGDYARQKAEVEARLLRDIERAAVVRLTKVLHPGLLLIGEWLRALRAGEVVQPLSDLVCSPISLPYATRAIGAVAEHGGAGVWHVSGSADLSYAAIAACLAARLGVPAERVQPATAAERGIPRELVTPHGTLSAQRLQEKLGLRPQPIAAMLDDLVAPAGASVAEMGLV